MLNPGTHRSAARGIALLEVLVALLIFMIGVLGLVGLQATMTRAQTQAQMRADAGHLANEAIGRMWSDVANIALYDGSNCATQARCLEWQKKVAQGLPRGAGSITVDAAGHVSVTVTWALPGGDTHKYVSQTAIFKSAS